MSDTRRRSGPPPSRDRRGPQGADRRSASPRRHASPVANVGDVADLTVVTVNDTGAFLDWGHPRDLLLPYGEQRLRPVEGRRVLVMITEDREGRPVASQRLERFLADTSDEHRAGDEVALVISETTDLGIKAVVDSRCWGLLYHDDLSRPLRRGQRLTGYVKRVREDGRLDLSLLPPGEAKLDVVGEQVLKALRESGGYLGLSDKSPAPEIKARLKVSKNAFKQAIGRLYKRRLIVIEEAGIRLAPREGAAQTGGAD
ncbi:CvfB family protein [Halomonas sp. V046]|uniref:CvfB family protein n=1 Tax=Halomonas sp. V046 TaxID=3459611 RepID=UPI004044786C